MLIKGIIICLFVFFHFHEISCDDSNISVNKKDIPNLFLTAIMKKMNSTTKRISQWWKPIVRKIDKMVETSKFEVQATNMVANKAYGECPGHDKNWTRIYGMNSCYLWYEYDESNDAEDITWFWARDYCEKNGGRLYEPYSKTKKWRNELYLGKSPKFVTLCLKYIT